VFQITRFSLIDSLFPGLLISFGERGDVLGLADFEEVGELKIGLFRAGDRRIKAGNFSFDLSVCRRGLLPSKIE
jgi:hypothetical protein